ncbi:MAG: PP2C family protein-serine/threonine phosphatase [Calditrichia bacterium]
MNIYLQIFFSTLCAAYGVIHAILFFFNRQLKSHLYFALCSFFYAISVFFDFQEALTTDPADKLFYLRIHRASMAPVLIFALLYNYSFLSIQLPKQFWVVALLLIAASTVAVFEPRGNFIYLQLVMIVVLIEIFRVIRFGIKSNISGAWIFAIGFFFLCFFVSYDLLVDLGLINMFYSFHYGSTVGFVGLIISMSVYLAQDFAKTNKRILEEQRHSASIELKQRVLEVEDARKSQELDEARKLQLSMLPLCIDEVEGFDICFEMNPATEVGGDYYDYRVTDDGTLTLVVGDATGHGMKAGIMVSVMKSLFIALDSQDDIPTFFQRCSRIIKRMNLGNLYMALMVVRIKDGNLICSSAGMPPLWIYRALTDTVEEFVIKGMPLGAFDSFSYKIIETELASGDVVLLMSDGLSEMFNKRNEMLDDPRIMQAFKEAAKMPADQIAQRLISTGESWRDGRSQEDDVTIGVLRIN